MEMFMKWFYCWATVFWPKEIEPAHDKTNKMICVPSKDSDQPGHPLRLMRVFTGRKGHFVGSVVLRLNC